MGKFTDFRVETLQQLTAHDAMNGIAKAGEPRLIPDSTTGNEKPCRGWARCPVALGLPTSSAGHAVMIQNVPRMTDAYSSSCPSEPQLGHTTRLD